MVGVTREVVVVTGAGGGIGVEACRQLRAVGLEPFVADIDAALAQSLAEEFDTGWFPLDVTSPESWTAMRQKMIEEGAATSGLILNAGLAGGGDLTVFDRDRYRALFAVNVDGVVNGMATFLDDLSGRQEAAIVVTASLAGITGTPFDPFYAMTKHALIGLVRSVAPGLSAKGVRVQAVCPGIVDTPLLGLAKSELAAADYPLLTSDEVAAALVECVRGIRTDTVTVLQVGRAPMAYRFAGVPGPGGGSSPLPEHLPIGRVEGAANS